MKGRRLVKRTSIPLRWDQVPHVEIRLKAQAAMSLGSPLRAAEDSLRFILNRRLPRNNPADHMRYIELESARVVETLRFLRDQYRAYFEQQGCNPLAEMYWVVVRFGVKDWAIMILRAAVFNYIAACRVKTAQWQELFDCHGPFYDSLGLFPKREPLEPEPFIVEPGERLTKDIVGILPQSAFDFVSTGGPFGRDYQILRARSYPGKAFLLRQETFQGAIDRRLSAWDAAQPWVEGLVTLFDATQDEVFAQFDALGPDAKEAESQFVQLPQFHRIAHEYLVTSAPAEVAEDATPSDKWLPLLIELDQARITPEESLQGIARETLMAARRKGLKVTTWQECYASTSRVSLEDGKVRTLRREVTHAIHNAAKKADYQLAKVWTRNTPLATKQSKVLTNPGVLDAKG